MKNEHKPLKEAFLEAYTVHSDAIFRYCFFRLGDKEKVKDVVQEVFMKTWNYMQDGREIGNMRAFLYTTVSHLIIDEYRKRKPVDSLESMEETSGFELSQDDTGSLIDHLDGKQAIELLSRIPERYGEAVFMRYVEELTLSEMADILGESENTLAVRVHRGIGMLKKIFNHEK